MFIVGEHSTVGPEAAGMSTPLEITFALRPDVIEVIAQRAAVIVAETVGETRSPWLTVEEAAEYLRWSKNRVYKHVGKDGIPHRKHGRRLLFHRQELDEWLEGYREGWCAGPRRSLREVTS